MFDTHQSKIAAYAKRGPDEFARVITFVYATIQRKHNIKTHMIEKEKALNEGMRWVVLDAADHSRLWYAFFDTEESAIKAYLACTGASLETYIGYRREP